MKLRSGPWPHVKIVSEGRAKSEAQRFFDKACPIEGPESFRSIDLHHLEAQHSFVDKADSNFVENLVPLSKSFHGAIHERTNRPNEFQYDSLRSLYFDQWHRGDFRRCYLIARIGYRAIMLYDDNPDIGLQLAIDALHACRPIWWPRFAADLIHRDIRPLFSDRIRSNELTAESAGRLCAEMSGWHECAVEMQGMRAWLSLGDETQDRLSVNKTGSVARMSLDHHGSIMKFKRGKLHEAQQGFESIVERLETIIRHTSNKLVRSSVNQGRNKVLMNSYNYLTMIHLFNGNIEDAERCHGRLEELFGPVEPLNGSGLVNTSEIEAWSYAGGYLLVSAEVKKRTKRRFREAYDYIEATERFINQAGISTLEDLSRFSIITEHWNDRGQIGTLPLLFGKQRGLQGGFAEASRKLRETYRRWLKRIAP